MRSRSPHPKLSDAEVIAMEIVGESIGIDEDNAIHRFFEIIGILLKGCLRIDQPGIILNCKAAPADIDEPEMFFQQQVTVWIERKLPAHTINCFLNHVKGNPILQFGQIFS